MKILIICNTMTYLSGSPLYNYTLAMELKNQNHDVSIYSMWEPTQMLENLLANKITTWYEKPTQNYDLVIISQAENKQILNNITFTRCINVIHSEYDCETPIINKHITSYIAIRPSIKQHLIDEHNLPAEKIKILYNGIDFNRFSIKNRNPNKNDFVKIVIPCTIDLLRINFLNYYANRANKNYQVFIYGKDYGNNFKHNQYVHTYPEVFNIQDYILDADIVAGILLGRINIEARAMGIVSYIHDPENPVKKEIFYPNYEEFKKRHDIINLAKNIII